MDINLKVLGDAEQGFGARLAIPEMMKAYSVQHDGAEPNTLEVTWELAIKLFRHDQLDGGGSYKLPRDIFIDGYMGMETRCVQYGLQVLGSVDGIVPLPVDVGFEAKMRIRRADAYFAEAEDS